MERILYTVLFFCIPRSCAFGSAKFAYCPRRGARDTISLCLLSWLQKMEKGFRIAIYCADVAGAFDKVDSARLLCKFRSVGVPVALVAIIQDWLSSRVARVTVSGFHSRDILMSNMVFQGTVLGPPLWNIFTRTQTERLKIWVLSRLHMLMTSMLINLLKTISGTKFFTKR